MFSFVSLFKVKVVISEEMVMILRTHRVIAYLLLLVFVGVEESRLILLQLVKVVLIVKVFRVKMGCLVN